MRHAAPSTPDDAATGDNVIPLRRLSPAGAIDDGLVARIRLVTPLEDSSTERATARSEPDSGTNTASTGKRVLLIHPGFDGGSTEQGGSYA